MKQETNGNGELYTPGHCKECRDSEHGDYGNGDYFKVYNKDYASTIMVCSDHYQQGLDDGVIDDNSPYKSFKKQIPENDGDER